jgi:hypothetical protein
VTGPGSSAKLFEFLVDGESGPEEDRLFWLKSDSAPGKLTPATPPPAGLPDG